MAKQSSTGGGKVVNTVRQMAAPVCEEAGVMLWDVEYIKEGADWFLRVLIDSVGGVDMDTCERVSRKMSTLLDENDPTTDSYYLEVGSPGIERKLNRDEHLRAYTGKPVKVFLYAAINGEKQLTGELKQFDEKTLWLQMPEGEDIEITRSGISRINAADFDLGGQE